ncbi:MAG: hypothetical protein JW727_06165 [Candidatus Aenigmarchaeota archaeon]|nr:hypothetical protein [Candidatus Aenigmarchaeota archaeon]
MANLGYTIGVSSGVFSMASPQEKIGQIDLAQKGFYTAFKGVTFTQIDLETSAEFLAPGVMKKLEQLREMNIHYGIHGLSTAMGANGILLDSAVKEDWERTHACLLRDIERSGKAKAMYLLQHASETKPYGWLGKDFQSTQVVDIWGRPLWIFLQENENVFNWLIHQEEIRIVAGSTVEDIIEDPRNPEKYSPKAKEEVKAEMDKEGKTITQSTPPEQAQKLLQEFQKRVDERIKKLIEKSAPEIVKFYTVEKLKRSELSYGPERLAYLSIGKWMSDKGDPLWKDITKGKKMENVKNDPYIWVPAVSLKYIWGHFFPEEAKGKCGEHCFKDPKPFLSQYQIPFVIETETMKSGMEDLPRAANPAHFVILCREMEKAGCKWFRTAIDFEHCLGAELDPDKFIEEMGSGSARYVNTLHVGWPTPLGPAHVPIYLGSEQQEQLYRWMYMLRKRGFDESETRFIIFERAGGVGGDPVDQSTMSLKKNVEFLRKDVPPEKLSEPENLHFYGLEDSAIKMQETQIQEHFMDPIKGLLQVVEEQHGFIGGQAVGKGKMKEWEAGKMR